MADASKSVPFNQSFANDFQQKFEMYFLALIFTIVGLAIQSAKFSSDRWQWGLEISGWACLVAAGIVGLLRMRLVPGIFRAAASQFQQEDLLSDAKAAPDASKFTVEGQTL